jgi:uncharacterized membrane protein YedE/YeeE
MKYLFLVFGTVFGFLLSRAGATTFDFHANLFLFRDLQLLWVIAIAVAAAGVGFTLLKSSGTRSLVERQRLRFKGKRWQPGLVRGALMLGIGWGLTGSCPGTAPAMLGEGKLIVLFTIAGILAGTYLYGLRASREQDARRRNDFGIAGAAGALGGKNA